MTILVMHLRSVSFTFVARGLDLDNWSDLHGHTRQNGVGPIIESGIRTIFQPYDGNWVPFVYHAVTLDIRWIWFHAPLYLPWHHDDRYKDPWQDPCKWKAKTMELPSEQRNISPWPRIKESEAFKWSKFGWYIYKHVEHIRYKPNPLRMDATNPKLTTHTHAKPTLQLNIKSNLDHNMTFGHNEMCI